MRNQENPHALLAPGDVADWLGISTRTLDQWAYLGRGPSFVRVGRHRRYRRADIERWLSANTRGGAA